MDLCRVSAPSNAPAGMNPPMSKMPPELIDKVVRVVSVFGLIVSVCVGDARIRAVTVV